MTEKKMDFLETWLLSAGFKRNDYNEKWQYGDNTPQSEFNRIIERYEGRDPKM